MFCKNCGAKLDDDAKFCGSCGTVVGNSEGIAVHAAAITTPDTIESKNLNGLAGWLILIGLGILIQPLKDLYGIFSINLPAFASIASQSGSSQYSTLYNIAVYELINNIIFVIALIYLNILFYQKKKMFPRFFIIYLIGNFVLILIDYLMLSGVIASPDASSLGIVLLQMIVWIPYFLNSRRVKATFTQ
jgi:hypothetical protein